VIEKNLSFQLLDLFDAAYEHVVANKHPKEDVLKKLTDFVRDRFEVFLITQGFRQDVVRAAMPVFDNFGTLSGVKQLALLLQSHLTKEEGTKLVQAYKRAANIVSQTERKTSVTLSSVVQEKDLSLPQEKQLYECLQTVDQTLREQMQQVSPSYDHIVKALATLHQPLEAFFDHVTVMDEDDSKRLSRLRLLAAVREVFNRLTQFSALQG